MRMPIMIFYKDPIISIFAFSVKKIDNMNFKSTLFILNFMLITQFVLSQSEVVLEEKSTIPDYLFGKYQRTDLQQGEFSRFFFNEYTSYYPKKEITDLLRNKIYSYSITIILGTWCGDSKEQVPKFFKILDELDYNTNYIEIICVDRKKTAGIDISKLNVERVPTFIFFIEGIEKGRITETPSLTLEEDIYNILNN